MKIPKCFIVYILIICPLIFFILAIQISGKVCLSYNGFAVDTQKNIYLGKDRYIEVLRLTRVEPVTVWVVAFSRLLCTHF